MRIPFFKPWSPQGVTLESANGGAGRGLWTENAEASLSAMHQSRDFRLTSSGSDALEVSALAMRLGPGDEVIVPDYAFVTTASAFALRGARVIFVDVEKENLLLDPEKVAEAISPRTRAIVTINYAGFGSNLPALVALAQEHDLFLVEDNAHGLGASYGNQALGTFGDFSILSFHETKNASCGEGGAVSAANEEAIKLLDVLIEKGTDRKAFFAGAIDKYTWRELGSSFVLSDYLARLLVANLEGFSNNQARRLEIWDRYRSALRGWASTNSVRMLGKSEMDNHSAHIFALQLPPGRRQFFIDTLSRAGIGSTFHYQSLSESRAGRAYGEVRGTLDNSLLASQNLVRLPLYPQLSEDEVDSVLEVVTSVSL